MTYTCEHCEFQNSPPHSTIVVIQQLYWTTFTLCDQSREPCNQHNNTVEDLDRWAHNRWIGAAYLFRYIHLRAGQWKSFVVEHFDPPPASHQNFLNPLNKCKNVLTCPIATCIISVSFLNTILVCTTGVLVLLVTLKSWLCKAFLHGQTCSQVF